MQDPSFFYGIISSTLSSQLTASSTAHASGSYAYVHALTRIIRLRDLDQPKILQPALCIAYILRHSTLHQIRPAVSTARIARDHIAARIHLRDLMFIGSYEQPISSAAFMYPDTFMYTDTYSIYTTTASRIISDPSPGS